MGRGLQTNSGLYEPSPYLLPQVIGQSRTMSRHGRNAVAISTTAVRNQTISSPPQVRWLPYKNSHGALHISTHAVTLTLTVIRCKRSDLGFLTCSSCPC